MLAFLAVICAITTLTLASPTNLQTNLQQSSAGHHYTNEQDERKSEILAEDHDGLPLHNEYRRENLPFNPWNSYRQDTIQSQFNKFPPLFSMLGIPSTLYIPFPLIISPDYLYPAYSSGIEDIAEEQTMSRANGRRPSSSSSSSSSYRNSPIYYVRIPPTPYMFVPGLGYTSQPPIFTPMLSYNPLPTFPIQPPIQPAISSMINLPLNFLSNGKPSNIYQLDTNGLQLSYQQYSAPSLPSPPPPPPLPQLIPSPLQSRPMHRPQFVSSSPLIPDSKITHLKRPFLFNGRPDDIYILPNSFNPMQSIYQSPQQGYY